MRFARAAVAVLFIGLSFATLGYAQNVSDVLGQTNAGRNVLAPTGGPSPVVMSRPVDPAEYVVGPGDMVQLNLTGGVNRSWDALILPEGTLFVPGIGPVPMTGLTLVEARRLILQRLSTEYRGVSVDLRLLRPRTFLVTLIGETTHPGALEVSATSRASELLSDGLFAPNASKRRVEIRRKTPQGETRIPMDLTRYRLTGTLAQDPLLREGDVLSFPRVVSEATVSGAVARPGPYELTETDSLSRVLLELAGGVVKNGTDQAVLVRFPDPTRKDSLSFRIQDVRSGKFDVPMRDGDHVYVYYQPRYQFLEQVSIQGEVQRPGLYPLMPGLTRLTDLVRIAGGFLPEADPSALRVYRPGLAGAPDPELERLSKLGRGDMTQGEYETLRARVVAQRQDFRVDWNRVKPGGDLDLVLKSGDAVTVDRTMVAVRVEGEVRLPGLVQYTPGRKVSEYVRLAGGYSDRAWKSKVRVKRAVTGQTILAKDVASLKPGDLVWVPERRESATWGNVQSALLLAAQVATIVLAVRAYR